MGLRGTKPRPVAERFWEKVDVRGPDECWPWLAGLTLRPRGYGKFYLQPGVSVVAHRYSYESAVGSVSKGLQLDHLCRNTVCVNPAHLEPVTQQENIRRQFLSKTHCLQGHELAGANLYTRPNGKRCCRTCRRACLRQYRRRLKVAS